MMSINRIATVVLLVAAWCALWGDLSVANVVSGLAVAAVALAVGTSAPRRFRLVPLLRFAASVLLDLVVSTAVLAWEIVTPHNRIDEAIVAVPLPESARDHVLLLSIAIGVTPGTAVADVDADRKTLYVHVLHGEHRERVAEHARALAELACAALPARKP